MKVPVLVGTAFLDRYAIRNFHDGGVLIDLATGTYMRLNISATDICAVLADASDIGSAAAQLTRRWGRTEDAALRTIRDVVEGLGQLGLRREPPGAFRYAASPQGGYVLTSNGSPRVRNSSDGTSAWLASPDVPATTAQIFGYLRAIAPKLLFLQSTVVIHGSASRIQGGVRVISGESEAGKTTTARAFHAAGRTLFAEDMLVLTSSSPLRVYDGGETAINAWAARSAKRLAHSPHDKIDAAVLRTATAGEPIPVSEIWFIDSARRGQCGDQIVPRRLGETEGALAVMTSLFLGASSPDAWRVFLSLAGDIAAAVPLFETPMPAGLGALAAAAKSYTENSAS
jgi:hypothetical protein